MLKLHEPPEVSEPLRDRRGRTLADRLADGPFERGGTYSLSLWEHDRDEWAYEYEGLTLWGLRDAKRAVYARGYCPMSVLINRE